MFTEYERPVFEQSRILLFLSGIFLFCPTKFFRLSDSGPATSQKISRRLIGSSSFLQITRKTTVPPVVAATSIKRAPPLSGQLYVPPNEFACKCMERLYCLLVSDFLPLCQLFVIPCAFIIISSPEPLGSQGELIVYPLSRRPSSVRPSTIFKDLLL